LYKISSEALQAMQAVTEFVQTNGTLVDTFSDLTVVEKIGEAYNFKQKLLTLKQHFASIDKPLDVALESLRQRAFKFAQDYIEATTAEVDSLGTPLNSETIQKAGITSVVLL
jgi:DNA phosphorothioation-dependent restriction protein DptG